MSCVIYFFSFAWLMVIKMENGNAEKNVLHDCYLALRTALRCVSCRLPLFVDGMLFALFSKVLTTDLLWHKR